jgi:hypothetical protein
MVFTLLAAVSLLERSILTELLKSGLEHATRRGVRLSRHPIKILGIEEASKIRAARRERVGPRRTAYLSGAFTSYVEPGASGFENIARIGASAWTETACREVSQATWVIMSLKSKADGGAGESRTPGQWFRKPLLYPSELQPHACRFYHGPLWTHLSHPNSLSTAGGKITTA